MAIEFEKSNTKINLMKAFAGESQARNRYTFSASQAKRDGLAIVEKIFLFTADQEKEHAKLFYGKLASLCGESIEIESSFPINTYKNSVDLLKCAAAGEYEEYGDVYKAFSEEARAEGFEEISQLFHNVAQIEKLHGERFKKLADLIETGRLFESEKEERWFCLNCGNIHYGKTAPLKCEVCQHPQGYFINQDWILI